MTGGTNRFHILSFDGGGIKGLFSAAVLAAIEDDLGIEVTDHFDLITGSSTGGIIALGLGLGMRPRRIVEFFVEQGPKIFRNRLKLRGCIQFVRRKFPQSPLEAALRDPKTFGERLLGESRKRLVIPSYNLGEDDVYIFKTPHHERLRRDWKVPAWTVAMATSAAPTYFPAVRIVDGIRLIDGGVWANNPTMVGITEAVSMLGVELDRLKVLSLGTIDPLAQRPKSLNGGGLWQWRNSAIDVIMRGQSLGVQKQAQLLLGKNAVHRLDPRAPDGTFLLDRITSDELIAKAAHESRRFSPLFASEFQSHRASIYEPLYQREMEHVSHE
ncbi:MAG: patatin-like phospholipase family protein [Planctomycetes bacterium]|nr:patatin-like phospholipase family protein [Planctomycetota bacterium]